MTKKVFAFDLGSGSLGECVREGDKITYLQSLLLDADFASIKTQTVQRRGYRTRLAHQAREAWWQKIAREVGLEVLSTQQPTLDNPNLKNVCYVNLLNPEMILYILLVCSVWPLFRENR